MFTVAAGYRDTLKDHHVSDIAQQWDNILAATSIECGHCHGPVSPPPPGTVDPHYLCLNNAFAVCAGAVMPALALEDYVAHHLLGEMAKPAVAEELTRGLVQYMELEQAAQQLELAEMEDRADAPAAAIDAKRAELRRHRRTERYLMDEDAFSPRWLAAWWNTMDARWKQRLCQIFFTKIELRAGPAPDSAALHDARIILHWRARI
ncbi:hypothetical protein [Streptomyces roseochromogenus]|uniref:Recombinase zinc beta ribbon domain-containing protein n=1 Tax=Streptomyces roseochromogenus subsp. oscitans DS 12.976 TaxID=1352936 RepID=V6JDV7_STRRC|nr:hypothetical protein [Streptomyces roseochromogenus]EST17908.1 hypothetical protein M878_46140 [Streptomyces roseochromogenus subsp. oscitans DS 12.976]